MTPDFQKAAIKAAEILVDSDVYNILLRSPSIDTTSHYQDILQPSGNTDIIDLGTFMDGYIE